MTNHQIAEESQEQGQLEVVDRLSPQNRVLQELAKAHRKREPCGEGLGFQSRGLQNLTKRYV